MEIVRHIEDVDLPIPHPILTMGNFDGVHLGHQTLFSRVVEEARLKGGRSIVLTFDPHPLKLLAPERVPRLILAPEDKIALIGSFGVDLLLIQKFDRAFANLEAEEFVRRYLVERIKVRKVWVGKDIRFGKGRKGHAEDLRRWGADAGFEVGIVEAIKVEGERVSSSRVRQLVESGEVDKASRLLGRYHFVSGKVTAGHRRGRELGFPTANIVVATEVVPSDGIYATLLEMGGRRWPSVTNIGLNPTFGEGPRTIESYVFDFAGDIYGQSVRLFFVERIRAERKFPSPQRLIEQMKEDVLSAQKILGGIDPKSPPC